MRSLLVLFRHIDVVKKVGSLHHPEDLLHPGHGLVGEVLGDQRLEEALQLGQVLDHEGPVVRVVHLEEADQGHRDCPEVLLDLHQIVFFFRAEFLSAQQQAELYRDLDDVPRRFFRLFFVLGLKEEAQVN